jgi:large subunit ribosomal protein L24
MGQNIKKGDTVQVIRGNERTSKKRGKVLEVLQDQHRVRVEGIRLVKRHMKRGRDAKMPDGGIVEKLGSVELSNVMLVCPKCTTPTRVARKKTAEGHSVRICKQCDAQIDDKS